MTRRRDLVGLALLLAAPVAFFRFATATRDSTFAFEPMRTPPGFRRLEAGDVSSGGFDPLVGLREPGQEAEPQLSLAALCPVLFGDGPLPEGTVPIAAFSDYFCPYCRDLTVRLAARDGDGVRLSWHELPILGDASEVAARAALAADLQGAYPAFQSRLMRAAFQPTPAYLTALSDGLGLDTPRFLADMESRTVADRLSDGRRAARLLGIGATPTLVVGRTLVSGLISDKRLDALIALEREEGPVPC